MNYLDNAATTQPNFSALEWSIRVIHETYANPSSSHKAGAAAADLIEQARKIIATSMNCSAKEVRLTSGGTESNNLALNGAPELGEFVLSTHAEHPSVADCAVDKVGINKDGTYDLNQIEDRMKKLQRWKPRKTLALSLVNAETGIVGLTDNSAWDLCKKYDFSLHIDAVAAYLKMPLGFKCDSMSVSAHKVHGLKGVGALYVREGHRLYPMQVGGSQERGLRPGTENLLGIHHFGQVVKDGLYKHTEAQKRFEELLADVSQVNGGTVERVWSTSNLFFPKVKDVELFLHQLDEAGVVASAKSACSSGMPGPSKVLECMYGKDAPECAGSVRFGFAYDTSIEQVETAAKIIKKVLEQA